MESNTASVLVIEEHPLMRESLSAAIEAESDLRILEPAADLVDAFPLAISNQHDIFFLPAKPDIILFSLGNPGLDDLAALADLRAKLADTPILALTRDEVPGQEQAALEHGAQAVLKKSISREELLEALRKVRADISKVL